MSFVLDTNVGSEALEDDGEPFEEKMARLEARIKENFGRLSL